MTACVDPDPSRNPNRDSFSHCPGCGSKTLKPKSIKSFFCTDCGFSFFINCAAAAMALIFDDQKQLLVTRRKFHPQKGSLDLPGGFSEPGEGIDDCLKREIKEELNLDLVQSAFVCSFANTYPYKSVIYPVTDIAFVCQVKSLDPIAALDDVAGFEFIPVQALDPKAFGMDSVQKTIQFLKEKF
ncbi:MAG: NUDIX domain-containing protein [Desulfobacter sp.]|nr:NUDIX domain-containing protein [Desulfobacter sp.]WDP85611.1 MAG: NUDIX domain-containing protein [Desulfobacter sp.]